MKPLVSLIIVSDEGEAVSQDRGSIDEAMQLRIKPRQGSQKTMY